MAKIGEYKERLKARGVSEEDINKCFDVLGYIYIGQNVRDEGILQTDNYLRKNKKTIRNLMKGRTKLIEENFWYNNKLYKTTIDGSVLGAELVNQIIELNLERLISQLKNKPEGVLNFLVQYYISTSLTFDVSSAYYHSEDSWVDRIIANKEIWDIRTSIFNLLKEMKLCVVSRFYVSTRGGEEREKEFIISPEIRRFLNEKFNEDIINKNQKEHAKLYSFLSDFTYEDVASISENELLQIGPLSSVQPKLKKILNKLESGKAIDNIIYGVPATVEFTIVDYKKYGVLLDSYFEEDILNQILGIKILKKKPKEKFKETSEVENITPLVNALVTEKNNLYKSAAMFEGFEFFLSNPDTEKCVVQLFSPIKNESELKIFIDSLHHFIIESSNKHVLKFIKNEGTTSTKLEERLGITIPEDRVKEFDELVTSFKDLNNLRNHYSHLQNAKEYYKAGQLFYKRINKPFPRDDEDIIKIQKILLREITAGLKNLSNILESINEQ